VDDGFAYVTEIQDRMSEPIMGEIRSLKALQAEIKHSQAAIRELQGIQLKYREAGLKGLAGQVGLEIAKVRHHMGTVRTTMDEVGEKMEGGLFSEVLQNMGKITGPVLVAAAIEKIGEAAVEAGHKILELGVDAIESAEAKENAIVAYGGGEEGERTFREIDKVAEASHTRAEKAQEMARTLMLQGLEDTKLVAASVRAEADLVRVGQEAGAGKLQSIIERSLASGHFDAGKLGGGKGKEASGRALAGLGVQLPELIEDIAHRTGQSTAQVKLALQKGTVDTEVGIAALTDAIERGKIGDAARKTMKLEDVGTDWHNMWTRMTEDIDTSGVGQALADVEAILSELEGVRLDSAKSGVQLIVDAIGEGIDTVAIWGLNFDTFATNVQTTLEPVLHVLRDINDEAAKSTGHGFVGGIAHKFLENVSPAGAAMVDAVSGNAEGGRVTAPAPGEVFASVAPGEFIVPAGDMFGGGGDGGRQTHIDVGGIHIAVHGTQDAHELVSQLRPMLESEIADVFERADLEMGR
jgi:hypothetical protein